MTSTINTVPVQICRRTPARSSRFWPPLEECSQKTLDRTGPHLLSHFDAASPDASGHIHILSLDEESPFPAPNLPEDVECNQDREGEIVLEEHLRIGATAHRVQRRVEGCN
jgi:hypothetical protein